MTESSPGPRLHITDALGPRTVNIDSELPGCGFLNLGFEYDGQRTDCMEGITVERVEEALTACIND